jgi:hypothetical protein
MLSKNLHPVFLFAKKKEHPNSSELCSKAKGTHVYTQKNNQPKKQTTDTTKQKQKNYIDSYFYVQKQTDE